MPLNTGWNLVRLDEVAATPWRNGGGSTRELLAWPDANDWSVRLSVADVVQDGAFSSFPGVQRWFAVLAGAGVRLAIDGATQACTAASSPLCFDGGAAVDCSLIDGPTEDFNLMSHGRAATLKRVHARHAQLVGAMTLVAAYAHQERARATFDRESVDLEPRSMAWRWLAADGVAEVWGTDVLWMEIVL